MHAFLLHALPITRSELMVLRWRTILPVNAHEQAASDFRVKCSTVACLLDSQDFLEPRHHLHSTNTTRFLITRANPGRINNEAHFQRSIIRQQIHRRSRSALQHLLHPPREMKGLLAYQEAANHSSDAAEEALPKGCFQMAEAYSALSGHSVCHSSVSGVRTHNHNGAHK